MPRKSRNALAVVPVDTGTALSAYRPKPPADLSPVAADMWRSITASRPPGYFGPDSLALLEFYVRTTLEWRRLMAAAEGMDPVADSQAFARISRAADMHAARASQAATRLRLTHQATLAPRAAARAAKGGTSADEIIARYREDA